MKVTVITDEAGTVLGTNRHADSGEGGAGRLVAGPGQIAHEIELTEAMEKSDSAETLHALVANHLATINRNAN